MGGLSRGMGKNREAAEEGAKEVWYCEECGCGYGRCCELGRVIGWVQ